MFRYAMVIVLAMGTLVSCKKKEGYGGKSTIYGKVLEENYDNSGQLEASYYIPEKRVYIVFGDEDFYADEIRTDYEGKFKFSYLYPGDYRLYTYSECSPIDPCDSDVRKVEIQIKILNNGDVVVTDDLITEKW